MGRSSRGLRLKVFCVVEQDGREISRHEELRIVYTRQDGTSYIDYQNEKLLLQERQGKRWYVLSEPSTSSERVRLGFLRGESFGTVHRRELQRKRAERLATLPAGRTGKRAGARKGSTEIDRLLLQALGSERRRYVWLCKYVLEASRALGSPITRAQVQSSLQRLRKAGVVLAERGETRRATDWWWVRAEEASAEDPTEVRTCAG